jgi:hypothetical protein
VYVALNLLSITANFLKKFLLSACKLIPISKAGTWLIKSAHYDDEKYIAITKIDALCFLHFNFNGSSTITIDN